MPMAYVEDKKTEQNNELINLQVYGTDKVYCICRC